MNRKSVFVPFSYSLRATLGRFGAVALAAGLLCAGGAAQAKTWILSSDAEGVSTEVPGINIVGGIYDAFAAASGGDVEDLRGILHASTTGGLPATVAPQAGDVVVVASVQDQTPPNGVNATRLGELLTMAKDRPDLTFVFLNDGCCRWPDFDQVRRFLNTDIMGLPANTIGRNTSNPPGTAFYLNENSPYQASFAGVTNPVWGEIYGYYTNVPAPHALYLAGNAGNTKPDMPGSDDTVNAYGIVVPRQSYSDHACLAVFGDTSLFWPTTAALNARPEIANQAAELAEGILQAAATGGVCDSPAKLAADLIPPIKAPALTIGRTGTVQVNIANYGLTGTTAGGAGQVVITLPPELEVPEGATLPDNCTRDSATQVTCTQLPAFPVLPADGTPTFFHTLNIPVNALTTFSAGEITAVISDVPEEGADAASVRRRNNTTNAQISAFEPQPVPALGAFGLGGLAVALGALGMRRQRRNKAV